MGNSRKQHEKFVETRLVVIETLVERNNSLLKEVSLLSKNLCNMKEKQAKNEEVKKEDEKQPINFTLHIERLVDSIHLTTPSCETDSHQQGHPESEEKHLNCNCSLETFLQCLQNAVNSPEMKDILEFHLQNTLSEKPLRCTQCGTELT